MRYRSRVEIISQILHASMRGASKTRIMYSAYLSAQQLEDYLEFLQNKKLLAFEQEARSYSLTPRGLECMRACDDVLELIGLQDSNTEAGASTRRIIQRLETIPSNPF